MKKVILFVAVLLLSELAMAQVVAVVDHMKVPEAGGDAYLAIEKQWKAFHQARVNDGKLISWALYYVHNAGSASDYNFVTVNIYANLAQAISNTYTIDDLKKIFGDKVNDLIKRTYSSRTLAFSGTYQWEMGLTSDKPYKYMGMSMMKTSDMGAYLNMEKTGFLPAFKEAQSAGTVHGWSIWSRVFADNQDFQAVAINTFENAQQLTSMDYASILEKLRGSNDGGKLYDVYAALGATEKTRTIVRNQLWELLDSTTPKK